MALVLSLTLSSSDLPSSLELGPLINLFFLLLGQYSVSVELQTVISGYWVNVDFTRTIKFEIVDEFPFVHGKIIQHIYVEK